jgi:hypothetical protein
VLAAALALALALALAAALAPALAPARGLWLQSLGKEGVKP